MAVLASIHKISKTFGIQKLFANLTFSIESGQRIGLIGPNGAGKSTLLQILAKRQEPDEGDVSFAKHLRVGYLEQSPRFRPELSVLETLLEGFAATTENEQRASELISRLDLEVQSDYGQKKTGELSGGWLKRVALARELMHEPQLLLLDEPTNHLDIQGIQWLEDFLSRHFNESYLMITHDRLFLQNTCDIILDLDRRHQDGLIKFEGTYLDFLDLKDSLVEAQKAQFSSQKNILRRETEWLRRGAKARQTKQVARIQRAQQLKESVADLRTLTRERKVEFVFPEVPHNPKKVVDVQSVSLSRGDRLLLNDWTYVLRGRARVGLIGPNGCGKTSLLKMLMGELLPDQGTVKIADGIRFAYFSQKKEDLDPTKTLLQTLCPDGDYVHFQKQPVYAKSYLSRFHFRPDQMDLPVGKLSGGEQSRLLIAQLMLHAESVLILDEPTNDLDIESLDALQEALSVFEGAVILVTHDRYFMGQVCDEILAIDEINKKIVGFADLFQWGEWLKNRKSSASAGRTSSPTPESDVAATSNRSTSSKKLSYKEQREWDMMEETILKEEEKIASLQNELNHVAASDYPLLNRLTSDLQKQQETVESLYRRWQELGDKVKGSTTS